MNKIYDSYCHWSEETNFEFIQPDEVWEAATQRALRAVKQVLKYRDTSAYATGSADAAKEIRRLILTDDAL